MTDLREKLNLCKNHRFQFDELCRLLNMDKMTEESSWEMLNKVSQKFSLEGDILHWFCCALHASCRLSYTPTVGESNLVVMGNGVSLINLLKCCNMSIFDFLPKIKQWAKMADLGRLFTEQIEKLERSFSITFQIFQRFIHIFEKIFQCVKNDKKNTKYRSAAKCSSSKLKGFCWCLYLCVINENPTNTIDLVTSFHLLLCCIDYIYINVLADNRTDLLNQNFEGLPKNWNPNTTVSLTTLSIIEPLCHLTDAIKTQVESTKEFFLEKIRKFFSTETIFGDKETCLEILSNINFERNIKSLNSAYDQYILGSGEFDERILLNNRKHNKDAEREKMTYLYKDVTSFAQKTPLTRRELLPTKGSFTEPLANATNNVQKLQSIAHITELPDLIRNSDEEIVLKINQKLESMSQIFGKEFPNVSKATERFHLAKSLYFNLLEKIVRSEIKAKPNIDMKILLNNDAMHTILIACCFEIVLKAYDTKIEFPWILSCFRIHAFNFLKIIEPVVRDHDDILTRDIIKHLNYVEETCLESLAWQKSSPVYNIIKDYNDVPLPTWSAVDVNSNCKKTTTEQISPVNSALETFTNSKSSEITKKDSVPTSKAPPPSSAGKVNENKNQHMAIFLRKFYKLAWIRIEKLCAELFGVDECKTLISEIWTLFEYSITTRTELMKDRHLDQILMCAIYLYIRVAEKNEKCFRDIMEIYRKLPQAKSSIYREVLIGPIDNGNNAEKKNEYGDIIKFYNNIYVKGMQQFALQFSKSKRSQHQPQLSPHPTEKLSNPKKLTNNHWLYVDKMDKQDVPNSPNQIVFVVYRSPAKDLKMMNEIVNGKRNLPFNDDDIGGTEGFKKLRKGSSFDKIIREVGQDRNIIEKN